MTGTTTTVTMAEPIDTDAVPQIYEQQALVDADTYIRSTNEYAGARRNCEETGGPSRFSIQIRLVEIFGDLLQKP
jgi:hypothetical protein